MIPEKKSERVFFILFSFNTFKAVTSFGGIFRITFLTSSVRGNGDRKVWKIVRKDAGRQRAKTKGLPPELLFFETSGFSDRLLIEHIFSITDLGGKCKKGRKF